MFADVLGVCVPRSSTILSTSSGRMSANASRTDIAQHLIDMAPAAP